MKCPFDHQMVDCKGEVCLRHRNTSYHVTDEDIKAGKPDPNMLYSCEACYNYDYAVYQEMWDEYYRGCL